MRRPAKQPAIEYVSIRSIKRSEGRKSEYLKGPSLLKVAAIIQKLRQGQRHQVLLVKAKDNGRYLLIDGHHTLTAAQEEGWAKVPVLVVESNDLSKRYPTLVWEHQ